MHRTWARAISRALVLSSVMFGVFAGCGSSSEEEEAKVACELDPNASVCTCAKDGPGDLTRCGPEDVDGACFGNSNYCVCRPWRCGGTSEPCACEFGGTHFAKQCEGTNCCFDPQQNGGTCSCISGNTPCLYKQVTDCSFATIQPLLANTDGTYPRVTSCPP